MPAKDIDILAPLVRRCWFGLIAGRELHEGGFLASVRSVEEEFLPNTGLDLFPVQGVTIDVSDEVMGYDGCIGQP